MARRASQKSAVKSEPGSHLKFGGEEHSSSTKRANQRSIFKSEPGSHLMLERNYVSSMGLDDALDCCAQVVRPCPTIGHYRRSRKVDLPWVTQENFTTQQRNYADRRLQVANVNTAYKRKAVKVRPVDLGVSDGTVPPGDPNWLEKVTLEGDRLIAQGLVPNDCQSSFSKFLIPKFSQIRRGERLTPERLAEMRIGDQLWPRERELLEEMLFYREKVLAWNFTEMGRIRPEVFPPQEIRTIEHEAWQAPSFAIPKALKKEVIAMLRERIQAGALEECHGPYRNPWVSS